MFNRNKNNKRKHFWNDSLLKSNITCKIIIPDQIKIKNCPLVSRLALQLKVCQSFNYNILSEGFI